MTEVTYGFVDENNILRETAVFIEGDVETLERVKNEYGMNAYYKMNLEKELAALGEAYWSGTRFLLPSPYPSWIWDEENNTWTWPVPLPEFDPENPKHYTWDEETISWIEISIPE